MIAALLLAAFANVPQANAQINVYRPDMNVSTVTARYVKASSVAATGSIRADTYYGDGSGLSGISYAIQALSIDSTKLSRNSVDSEKLVAASVGNDKLTANAVDTVKIAADAVTAAAILGGSVGSTKLATIFMPVKTRSQIDSVTAIACGQLVFCSDCATSGDICVSTGTGACGTKLAQFRRIGTTAGCGSQE